MQDVQALDVTAPHGNVQIVPTAAVVSEQLQHAAASQLKETSIAHREGASEHVAQRGDLIGRTCSRGLAFHDGCPPVGSSALHLPSDLKMHPATSFVAASNDRSRPLFGCSPIASPSPTGPDSCATSLGDYPEFAPPQPVLQDHQQGMDTPGSPRLSLETKQDQQKPLLDEYRLFGVGPPHWVPDWVSEGSPSVPMQPQTSEDPPAVHLSPHAESQPSPQDLHRARSMFQSLWQRAQEGGVHSVSPPPSAASRHKRLHTSLDCEEDAPATASPQFHPTRSGEPSAKTTTRGYPPGHPFAASGTPGS